MFGNASTPSIFVSSWFTMVSLTPVPSFWDPRCLQIASISSNIMMWRSESSPCIARSDSASAKSFRMFSSLCPTYLFKTSGPFTTWERERTNKRSIQSLSSCRVQLWRKREERKRKRDFQKLCNLRFATVEHFPNLPSNEGFACTGRTKEQNSLDMLDSHLCNNRGRENSRCESSTEYVWELPVISKQRLVRIEKASRGM